MPQATKTTTESDTAIPRITEISGNGRQNQAQKLIDAVVKTARETADNVNARVDKLVEGTPLESKPATARERIQAELGKAQSELNRAQQRAGDARKQVTDRVRKARTDVEPTVRQAVEPVRKRVEPVYRDRVEPVIQKRVEPVYRDRVKPAVEKVRTRVAS